MDRITAALTKEFANEYGLGSLPDEKLFEHFAAFITIRNHYGETFAPESVVIGGGGDLGIDAIAIIVNGNLITEVEAIEDMLSNSIDYLDVSFIFVQAEKSSGFDGQKLINFCSGVEEFFKKETKEPRNEDVMNYIQIMTKIYDKSSKFKRGNPSCNLYYVTTGKSTEQPSLNAKTDKSQNNLRRLEIFRDVEVSLIGSGEIQKLYRISKNSIARDFIFERRQDIPEISGVNEAFVGFIPAKEFLNIVCSENNEINRSVFYDNVRDFEGYGPVNSEIKNTLLSEKKQRFILMNNGITIIARSLTHTGSKFHIEDFQVVNGCQTTHVLFDHRDSLDVSVLVPLRLIWTTDEVIINDIIQATNKQTEIRPEQFFALTDFARQLELYFQSMTDDTKRLYYERRSRQYDRLSIEKTRVITQTNAVKSFSAMFLAEPHSTSRRYKSLSDKIGNEIFAKSHLSEPYYTAAVALYRLEWLFRNKEFNPQFKVIRFQLLLVARLLIIGNDLPPFNSKKLKEKCEKINETMWDAEKAAKLFKSAANIITSLCGGAPDRDKVHTSIFTTQIIDRLSPKK